MLVTGASGHIGRRVAQLLAERGHPAWCRGLGAPEWEVDVWVGTCLAIAAGELARPSDAVLRLTGRAPCAFDDYFRERPPLLASLRGS